MPEIRLSVAIRIALDSIMIFFRQFRERDFLPGREPLAVITGRLASVSITDHR